LYQALARILEHCNSAPAPAGARSARDQSGDEAPHTKGLSGCRISKFLVIENDVFTYRIEDSTAF
jgi:hypothetical protein